MISTEIAEPILLTPQLKVGDPHVAYWLSQVTLRLRREVCWCWQQRAGQVCSGLPLLADAAADSLDLTRYDSDKRQFFNTDVTARYFSERLAAPRPPRSPHPARGSWKWVARHLELDDAAQFVLALGLAARMDASMGPVFSACVNDASRPYPTLLLAQRLWDDPMAIVACADPAHALFRTGLLVFGSEHAPGLEWYQAIEMHAWVAQTLVNSESPLPPVLQAVVAKTAALDANTEAYARRVHSAPRHALQIVPLSGPRHADFAAMAASLTARLGTEVVSLTTGAAPSPPELKALFTLCWLRGMDLVLPEGASTGHDHKASDDWRAALSVPARVFVPLTDAAQHHALPLSATLPPFAISPLRYDERVRLWRQGLGERGRGLEAAIAECSRRFRFQEGTLRQLVRALAAQERLTEEQLFAACRTEALNELGGLAQPVNPRFRLDEVVLPPAQAQQLQEIQHAMRALTTVHYVWGTARVWNESGLAVLFCGPSGTGKTMAAEALGSALAMPTYRIDLSQVVNKYIGETEKNLKRIFDAAELSDCILFFDEADALFGKRTEVKDAHDRFANIEISYLLERMERFKGLAILATNRRKDLDEAFMRRLRYVIEFPLPGVKERERIWRAVFPEAVDTASLDFAYLAKQFALAGGHIRSIAFNACLQSAASQATPKVEMTTVLVAVKRELDKLNRAAAEELFGRYAPMIRELVA